MSIIQEQKAKIATAAIITKLTRACASYIEKRHDTSLSSVFASDEFRHEMMLILENSPQIPNEEILITLIQYLLDGLSNTEKVIESIGRVTDEKNKAIKQAKSANAKKARAAKDRRLDIVRARAVQLASESNYQSYRSAAQSLAKPIAEFAQEHQLVMSEDQLREKTIYRWLKKGCWKPKKLGISK
ncbi:MAG: hypothetical protein ACRCYN_10190 [Plesiomonas sp.]